MNWFVEEGFQQKLIILSNTKNNVVLTYAFDKLIWYICQKQKLGNLLSKSSKFMQSRWYVFDVL